MHLPIFKFLRRSLSAKLSFITAAVAAGTVLTVGLLSYRSISQLAMEKSLERLDSDTKLLAPSFERAFSQMSRDVEMLALMPPVQGIMRSMERGVDRTDSSSLAQWTQRMQTIFRSLLTARPGYTAIRYVLVADGGREFVRVHRNDAQLEVSGPSDLHRLGDVGFFKRALTLRPGEVVFSDVSLYEEDGHIVPGSKPNIRVMTPVYDDAGKLFAIIVINQEYEALLADIVTHTGSTRHIGIADSQRNYYERLDNGAARFGFVGDADYAPSALMQSLLAAEGAVGTLTLEVNGRSLLTSYRDVDVGAGRTNHILRIARTEVTRELFAEANALRRNSILIGCALLAMAIVVGLTAGHKFAGPIHQMTEALSNYVATGAYAKLPTTRQDELGEFARTFQDLSRQLEETRARERAAFMQLRATIDQSVDGVITISQAGCIESFNPACERMFGYAAEEVVGRNVAILMTERDRQAHDDYLAEYRRTGLERIIGTVRHVQGSTKSGAVLELELSVSRVELPTNTIYSAFMRDVTGRKQQEEEFSRLTSLQKAIVDNASYPIIATELDGTISLFNPAAEKLLGYNSAEVVGKLTPAAIHDRDEVAAHAEAQEVKYGTHYKSGFHAFGSDAERGADNVHEWHYIRKDGARIPIRLAMTALRRDDGTVFGYLGMVQDLREQRKYEQELRASQRFLQDITDNNPATISYYDTELRLRFANRTMQQATGKTLAELRGKTVRELLPPALADHIEPHARRALNGEMQTFEHTTDFGGRSVTRLTSYVPDRQDGAVKGIYAVSLDITELKQAQRDLKLMNDMLQARTNEAEFATQAKSLFLANMSHEIRSPMNAILGMQQLLLSTALNAQQREYAEKAQTATKSLLHLLNDILDISKLEAGKIDLEREPFAIEELLGDLSVILSASTGNKPLEVLFDIDPLLPSHLRGDVLRLRQILLNLAGNAIKFTEQGEVVIAMRIAAQRDTQCEVEISVSDTGIGISPEKLHVIFEAFSQAESSTTRRFGGTGLGLAISQRLVNAMGGTLRVDSTLGVGSRFYFRAAFDTVGLSDTIALQEQYKTLLPQHTFRALIVDDNAIAREILLHQLRTLDIACAAAGSVREALALIEAQPPDSAFNLFIVDWKMPDMNGFDAARALRAATTGERPTVIMVSAFGREALANRSAGKSDCIDGLLSKPVTLAMLAQAINAAYLPSAPIQTSVVTRPQRLKGLRLLVVDDNDLNRQIADEMLTREGAAITVADCGLQAVELVRDAAVQFDGVLMDIQMPFMDGYEATRLIREQRGQLPILAMTANAMPADRTACLAAGMNEHIPKPIDIDAVVAALLKFCSPKGTSSAALPRGEMHRATQSAAVDSAAALRRLGNDHALYAQLIGRFLMEAPAMIAAFAQAGTTDRKAAATQMHTLKGLAATVGLSDMCEAAANIEDALRAFGSVDVTAAAEILTAKLAASSNELTALVAQLEPASTNLSAKGSVPADKEALKSRLKHLETLLTNSNMSAVDVFEELRAEFGAALALEVDALAQAVENLDFKQASTNCHRLLEKLA